jgi:hypothetical protein
MSISHQLRRPQILPSPDQWVPLANATNIFNNITINSNSTFSDTLQDSGTSGMSSAIGWLTMIFFCICAWPNIPDERYQRYPRGRRRSLRAEDPKAREERIEQSLTVKRVVTADAEGGLTLGEPLIPETESAAGDDASTSHRSMEEDDETSTCIICLEPFRVGDTVAWSKQSTVSRDKAEERPCLHVFHHDCIVPWLANPKHDDCPACRSIILQNNPEEIGLEDMNLEAPSSTPFVIMGGLVSRVRRASYSLIGQSVDVSAAEYADDDSDEDADDKRLFSVPQPSKLRRVFSLGERRPPKPKRLRRGSIGSQRDDKRTAPPFLSESLYKPIALRRVVSAGSGSSARSMHRSEGPLHTDADDGAISRPSRFPALRRTSSSIHARFSRTQESIEEDLQVVRSSVSWRDIDQSRSDHSMEDDIIIEIV